MASHNSAPIQNRPYRSHRVPACTRCRSRKIRCHIDIPGEPCLSCRERRLKCQYADPTTPPEENGDRRPPKKRRLTDDGYGDALSRPHSAPVLHRTANNPSASILLAPHVAEDIDILQRHISQHRTPGGDASDPYKTLTHDTKNPIVLLSVPRYRTGLRSELGAGKEQLEITEQILGPFKREVIDLYLTHVHYNLPVLEEELCFTLRNGSTDKIPKNVMCVVYALGTAHWRKSETLKMHPKPDCHYVWNKAISAVLDDFLSPSLPTVAAAVLDQCGRPSVSIVGNITLSGRTSSLAQTFGLHRDPSKWNITDEEKSDRIRVWWGVLITDYWSSIAYGNPPHIAKGYYDVPMPSINQLASPKASMAHKYSSTCFVHLCALTELLGDILPLVYQIDMKNPEKLSRSVEKLKIELQNLESQLPEWLPLPNRNGTTNLWFCFLSMRLVLSRVALRAAILLGDKTLESTRLKELRTASSAVLDFVLSLGESQFYDFWFPYATHLLVQAVTVSLRCTVESQDTEMRNENIKRLEHVIAHIQYAYDNYDWDIANYCLERCSDSVSKISALVARESQPAEAEIPTVSVSRSEIPTSAGFDEQSFLLSDILDPNAFDFPWEALWDTPSGMTNFSI
ncbi:C6 transcription factor-like protein [Corynespora cassiicola Philippines]|uniref:C6 transcription factor-like protein n=1 Tax=Corynespora cassiicola Philippines TaxID=1448308 RepID=A0A2T2NH17_CORCC|nr:C6 transcription factor-like protein [Corynespora cassiicola Philippines]